jgi:surfactin synthase thioesterase subunit
VVTVKDVDEDVLVSYISGSTGVEAIRESLRQILPSYMIPTYFIQIENFPLNSNGKIDKKMLKLSTYKPQRHTENQVTFTPTEEKLAQLWKHLLKIDQVSNTDNFFEIGGHSLLAVTLSFEIQQTFNCQIPVTIIFQNPTIQTMAQYLLNFTKQQSTNSAILHSLKTTNSTKTPLFCIHPAGGTIAVYEELSRSMGDIPVYAIEFPSKASETYSSIREMAKDYLRIISETYSGPLCLCGFSLGGIIAFEMAKIAHEQNKTVKLVALLDSKLKATENVASDEEIASILLNHLEKKSNK